MVMTIVIYFLLELKIIWNAPNAKTIVLPFSNATKKLVEYKGLSLSNIKCKCKCIVTLSQSNILYSRRDHFIWITSDGVGPAADLAGLEETGAGGFHVQLYSTGAPGFPEYFENLSPTTSDNPWISALWEAAFNCRVDGAPGGVNECDSTMRMADVPGYSPYPKTALFLDSVKTFAYALHAYILDNCPAAFGKREQLRSCVQPPRLRPYLYNVTFEGSYGTVRFDANGDADGKYSIDQLQKKNGRYVLETVGFWDKATRTLTLDASTYWNTKPMAGVGLFYYYYFNSRIQILHMFFQSCNKTKIRS